MKLVVNLVNGTEIKVYDEKVINDVCKALESPARHVLIVDEENGVKTFVPLNSIVQAEIYRDENALPGERMVTIKKGKPVVDVHVSEISVVAMRRIEECLIRANQGSSARV
ncbi:MAG: hypothetical protein JWM44_1340 [Bacilli bacterium]|nr:hypothetical protein [Bacilli bacterium]